MRILVILLLLSSITNLIVDYYQAKTIREHQVLIQALQHNKEAQNKVIMRLVNLNGGLR